MFKLQSNRLGLWALPCEQLELLTKSRNALERHLGLNLSNFELNADDSFTSEISSALLNFVIPRVKLNPSSYEWFTHWLIVDQGINTVVGGIGGNGLPDENGRVMIGYYIDKKFESRGYATEAVGCLTSWMQSHPELQTIAADTLVDNIASHRVLQKAGFQWAGQTEEGWRWQLARC